MARRKEPAPKPAEPEPTFDVALAEAKKNDQYATVDRAEVDALIAKGFHPVRADSPKPYREQMLYVFDLSVEKARDLIYG